MPDYQPKTLLIEEPEANLHPKYQSLLADMLIDAADKFNIQFIIETHSEYLIRKLQYWVAKGTIKPTDVALYYLNDPESENVKNGKARQVERIEIKEDGSIEENYEKYWSGFFDEITTLKDKLQQAQLEVDIKRLKEELDKIKGNTKCIVLTEDSRKDSIENLEVLFKSSGFNWSEVECYSYGGCTKVNAIQFLTDYFNKKSLPMSFVVHRDRDYKSEEEIEKWIKNIKKLKGKLIKIHPFVTQGTMVESYFLNANHINAIYPQISVSKAQDFIDEVKDNVATVSIDKMKKEFLLDKNNNKVLTDKEINQKYNNERDRYIYGKVACGLLKSKVQEEIKENCLLNQYSIFIKDTNLEQIAKEIWS